MRSHKNDNARGQAGEVGKSESTVTKLCASGTADVKRAPDVSLLLARLMPPRYAASVAQIAHALPVTAAAVATTIAGS